MVGVGIVCLKFGDLRLLVLLLCTAFIVLIVGLLLLCLIVLL